MTLKEAIEASGCHAASLRKKRMWYTVNDAGNGYYVRSGMDGRPASTLVLARNLDAAAVLLGNHANEAAWEPLNV